MEGRREGWGMEPYRWDGGDSFLPILFPVTFKRLAPKRFLIAVLAPVTPRQEPFRINHLEAEREKSSGSDPKGTDTSLLPLPSPHVLELLEQRGERTGVIFHGCREQSSPAWFSWLKCFPAAVRAHPRHTKAMHMQGPVVSCSSRRCRGAGDGRSGGDAPAPLPGQGMAEAGSESASAARAQGRGWGGERGRGGFGTERRHPWVQSSGLRGTIVFRAESGGGRRPL